MAFEVQCSYFLWITPKALQYLNKRMGNVFFAYCQLSSLTKNMFRDFLGELGLTFAGFCVGMKKLVAFTSLVPGCKNIRGQKSSPYTESSSQN